MTAEQAVRLVEITKRKADELFDELIAELESGDGSKGGAVADAEEVERTDRTAATSGYDVPWELPEEQFVGDWELSDPVEGLTYRWPDGQFSEFDRLVTATGSGDFDGITLALGYEPNGNVVGFVVGQGGSRRGITVFFPADDFASSNEKLSMIRGGGKRGRAGFAPSDATPVAYGPFEIETLGDRISGKWSVQAVVADADDAATMLSHTAIQARLRRLV